MEKKQTYLVFLKKPHDKQFSFRAEYHVWREGGFNIKKHVRDTKDKEYS